MNLARYQQVLDQIRNHPETWKQEVWHTQCGTKHCVAGWAQVLSGQPVSNMASEDARRWLDVSVSVADYLFASYRTLEDLILYNGEPDPVSVEDSVWMRRPISANWWMVATRGNGEEPGPWLATTHNVTAAELRIWDDEDRNCRLSPEEYVMESPTRVLWHGPIVQPPFPEL